MHSLELWRDFIYGDETGSPGRAVSLHLARSGSQSEHRIRRILPARGACHIIKDSYCAHNLAPKVSPSFPLERDRREAERPRERGCFCPVASAGVWTRGVGNLQVDTWKDDPQTSIMALALALGTGEGYGRCSVPRVLCSLVSSKDRYTLRAEPLLSLSFIHGKNKLCTNLVHPLKSP